MTHAGNGFVHIEAIGLVEVEMRTKAQFEHQQRVIEQVGPPAWGRQDIFADPDQGGFEISALGMSRIAWTALAGRIDGAPVEESEAGTVALHNGVGIDHLAQR
jgi:hypothetical protein